MNHTPRERDVGVLGKCLHALNLHTRQHRSPQSKSKNSRMQQTKELMSYTDGKWSVMGGLVVLILELGEHPLSQIKSKQRSDISFHFLCA